MTCKIQLLIVNVLLPEMLSILLCVRLAEKRLNNTKSVYDILFKLNECWNPSRPKIRSKNAWEELSKFFFDKTSQISSTNSNSIRVLKKSQNVEPQMSLFYVIFWQITKYMRIPRAFIYILFKWKCLIRSVFLAWPRTKDALFANFVIANAFII